MLSIVTAPHVILWSIRVSNRKKLAFSISFLTLKNNSTTLKNLGGFMIRVYIFLLLVLISCKEKEQANSNSTPATTNQQNAPTVSNSGVRHYVQIASLKMRATPDLKGEKVALLEKGDSFLILEESEHWTEYEGYSSKWGKINFQGQEGWVYLAYLSTEPPDLLTDKERERITNNYNKEVEREEKEVARMMANDPNFQSCSPAGCGVMDAEFANAKRGCKGYKVDEINNMNSGSFYEAAEKYGDAYCKTYFMNQGSQCAIRD